MIEAPLNALMGVIVPLLKADATLQGLVGGRVYDHVPTAAEFPYVALGSAWERRDDADCIPAVEVGFRLDVWSRATGLPEARRVAHRVVSILHDVALDLPEGALAMLEHMRTDQTRAPDGLTSQASIEFQATIET